MATKYLNGPFNLKWGSNVLEDVDKITFKYSQASNNYTLVNGQTKTFFGSMSASITLSFLAPDTATLRMIFPQYYVPKGSKLSTGETVVDPDGAIDISAAQCSNTTLTYPLDVIGCGMNSANTLRLINAYTSLSAVNVQNDNLITVDVVFTGQPNYGEGTLQFFTQGGIDPES